MKSFSTQNYKYNAVVGEKVFFIMNNLVNLYFLGLFLIEVTSTAFFLTTT